MVNLPIMIVCLGACVVILSRWGFRSAWSMWALFGFGLGFVIAIVGPITQGLLRSWVSSSGDVIHYTWIFSALALFWSVLHAIAYGLIFMAVLEGRK